MLIQPQPTCKAAQISMGVALVAALCSAALYQMNQTEVPAAQSAKLMGMHHFGVRKVHLSADKNHRQVLRL